MGVDTPLAALSGAPAAAPRLLQAALRAGHEPGHRPAARGARDEPAHLHRARGNLLDEPPEHARRVAIEQPVLLPGDLDRLRALPPGRFRVGTLRCLFDPSAAAARRSSARSTSSERGLAARATRPRILVLSDRGADESRSPIPILLATAAVHSHLVREGSRDALRASWSSRASRARSMHFALLIGYGAAAISPYLAFHSLAGLHAAGELGELTLAEAQQASSRRSAAACLRCSRRWASRRCSPTAAPRSSRRSAWAASRRALLHRHALAGRRHRPRAGRGRRGRPPARGLPDGDGLDAGGLYRLRIQGEQHVWNAALDRAAAAGGARRELPDCSAPTPRRSTRPRRRRDPAQPARAAARRAAGAARRGRAVERDRAPLRDRRHVARRDLAARRTRPSPSP